MRIQYVSVTMLKKFYESWEVSHAKVPTKKDKTVIAFSNLKKLQLGYNLTEIYRTDSKTASGRIVYRMELKDNVDSNHPFIAKT